MRSKRLARQIKRAFGEESFEDGLPSELRAQLSSFLDDIDKMYQQLDDKALMAQHSLEVSSTELTQANDRLFNLNRTFDAMLNSLGQGFLMFDATGVCSSVHSKACESVLECNPSGRHIADVLRVPEASRSTFMDWCELLFSGRWDFEHLAGVGQSSFKHSEGRTIALEYKPVQNADGELMSVVVIATDKTVEFKAKEEASRLQSFANMVVSILRNKPEFLRFVSGSRDLLSQASRILKANQFEAESIRSLRRILHTLKGASATFGVYKLTERIHQAENVTSEITDFESVRQTMSREIKDIETELELLLQEQRSVFGDILDSGSSVREIPITELEKAMSVIQQGGGLTAPQLQSISDLLLSVPLKKMVAGYDSQVQVVARRINKKVAPIVFTGQPVRVNPEACDPVLRELVHVFTNIVVHGIEDEAQRKQAGKPVQGQITVDLASEVVGGRRLIQMKIADDGRGIDPERIRNRWKTKSETMSMTDDQLIQLVFEPGFTLASSVTEYAGRGVGLNALKNTVESCGGKVFVTSTKGQGTAFIIEFPHPEEPVGRIPKLAV